MRQGRRFGGVRLHRSALFCVGKRQAERQDRIGRLVIVSQGARFVRFDRTTGRASGRNLRLEVVEAGAQRPISSLRAQRGHEGR